MTEERQTEEEAAAEIEDEAIREQNDLIRFAFIAGAAASFGEEKFEELDVTTQALNLTVDVIRQLVMTDAETREKAANMMRERIDKINEKAKELEDAADAEKEVAEAKGEDVSGD